MFRFGKLLAVEGVLVDPDVLSGSYPQILLDVLVHVLALVAKDGSVFLAGDYYLAVPIVLEFADFSLPVLSQKVYFFLASQSAFWSLALDRPSLPDVRNELV